MNRRASDVFGKGFGGQNIANAAGTGHATVNGDVTVRADADFGKGFGRQNIANAAGTGHATVNGDVSGEIETNRSQYPIQSDQINVAGYKNIVNCNVLFQKMVSCGSEDISHKTRTTLLIFFRGVKHRELFVEADGTNKKGYTAVLEDLGEEINLKNLRAVEWRWNKLVAKFLKCEESKKEWRYAKEMRSVMSMQTKPDPESEAMDAPPQARGLEKGNLRRNLFSTPSSSESAKKIKLDESEETPDGNSGRAIDILRELLALEQAQLEANKHYANLLRELSSLRNFNV